MSKHTHSVWINMDESIVDLTVLENRLDENGIDLIQYRTFDKEEIIKYSNENDAIISASEQWDSKQLSKLKEGTLIAKYGSGVNNINVDAATDHGILVSNLPGANSNAVAEVALLHILNLCRNFTTTIEHTKNNGWPGTVEGTELDGKVVGLYGYGNIAKLLAKKLKGFDVEILVFDKYASSFEKGHISVSSKEELFERSDIVSLHIPFTSETDKIVDENLLKLLGHKGMLVNTCRGEVVDEIALLSALENNKIHSAGLDVLTNEPPIDISIYDTKNLYITSHMGAATVESETRSQEMLASTIVEYLVNNKISGNILNKEEK